MFENKVRNLQQNQFYKNIFDKVKEFDKKHKKDKKVKCLVKEKSEMFFSIFIIKRKKTIFSE